MGSEAEKIAFLAARLREQLVIRHRARLRPREGGGGEVGVEAELEQLLDEEVALLGPEIRRQLEDRVLRDTIGLGPLEDLLADPEVEEVLVNGHREVWAERAGRLERVPLSFESDGQLRDVIERVLGPIGRRVDELSPMADGRLADGSRVNVVIPPLAVDGPAVSIRRFGTVRPGPEELVRRGAVPSPLMELLAEAVAARRSVLISGGTGSGKTTALNALSSFIAAGERVITIEDAAELQLRQPHVVRLESRPVSIEGSGAVSIRDLVRNALRMRPDRLIIGEVRGAEAIDLIAALNTGHRGALSTVHANSPEHALRRLETLALMSDVPMPHGVLREQLASAIDLILHLERRSDGSRGAVALKEVKWLAGGVSTRELWVRQGDGLGAETESATESAATEPPAALTPAAEAPAPADSAGADEGP